MFSSYFSVMIPRSILAASGGNPACVQMLLDAKADITAVTCEGHTALMLASNSGETECVNALISELLVFATHSSPTSL